MYLTRRLRSTPIGRTVLSYLSNPRHRLLIIILLLLLIYRSKLATEFDGNQTLIFGEERRLSIRLFKSDDSGRSTLRPFRILSGSLHYFRVAPESWAHRIELIKAAGLNTVETFVPWNIHEREKGRYQFDNLIKFLELVHQNELFTIIRPSRK